MGTGAFMHNPVYDAAKYLSEWHFEVEPAMRQMEASWFPPLSLPKLGG